MFKRIRELFTRNKRKQTKTRKKSGHHKKAVSDGFRRGSSEAARIMAKWRWKKK